MAILNTGIYMLGMVLMKDDVASFLGTEATAQVVFVTVFGLIWLNFVLEIAVNVLIAPAVHRIVLVVEKKVGKKSAAQKANTETEDKVPENPTDQVK